MSADVTATVRDVLAARLRLEVTDLDDERTFMELGADSLSLLAVVRDLDERLGVQVPVRTLFESANTSWRLAEFLAARCDPPRAEAAPTRPDLGDRAAARPAPPAPVPVGSEAAAVLNAQLDLTDKLVTTVTDVIRQQLEVLRRGAPVAGGAIVSAAPAGAWADREPRARATRPAVSTSGDAGLPGTGADFSLYFFGDYPARDEPDKYRHIIEAARFADQNGFHTVWLPERHFHSFGALFPSPSVLAAGLATQTTRIRLHAGSVVLPLHDPIRVAEEWSLVDNLSGGRVGLCFASGWHANDFVLAPEMFGRHREVMYERLDTVRRLWHGEKITAKSGSGDPVEVGVYPRPVQPDPPLFAAVLGNPDSYRKAARHGLGVVTNLMTQGLDELAVNIRGYREARAEFGLDPRAGRVVVLVHSYLDVDQGTAREQARGPFRDYLRSSISLFSTAANSLGFDVDLATTSAEDLEYLLDAAFDRYCEERAMIGNVADAAGFARRLTAAGADEIACFIDFGIPPDQMLAGLPQLAELLRLDEISQPGETPRLGSGGLRTSPAPLAERPASALQRRMWLVEQLQPGTGTYHEPKALLLDGPLDVPALYRALNSVAARHPQLRTVFREQDGKLRQVIWPAAPIDCPLDDCDGLAVDAVLESFATQDADLDLENGPLFRARVVRLAARRHLLLLVAHHIIFDSSSASLFWRDLAAYYRRDASALPDLPEPPALPPSEPGGIEFWREALAGAPPLRLPADRPRACGTAAPTAGARTRQEIPAGLADRVRALAREHDCTLFMALLAALGTVLGRLGGTDDVLIGTAVSNRPAGYENAVGMFVETLAFRLDLSGEPGFADLLHRVRDWAGHALEHRDVPFDEVVSAVNPERAPGMNPLFQVMMAFESARDMRFEAGLAATVLEVPRAQAPFDLTFYMSDGVGEDRRAIGCTVEYDAALFEPSTVQRMLEYLEVVLLRAAESPASPVSGLAGLTPSDADALEAFEGRLVAGETACLHELVRAQAERTPDAIAVEGIGDPLTYRALTDRAHRLACSLAADGLGFGDLVGVLLPRGPDLIVAMLAVLGSGAGYLPIDPSLPAKRIRLMLADSGAALLLTDQEIDVPVRTRRMADGEEDVPPDQVTLPVMTAGAIAYCMYTSGSTGRPKGVLVPHRGPANMVAWHLDEFPPLSTLQWTSSGFDVSVQEIFTTLGSGATLTLIPDDDRRDPRAVLDRLRTHGVQRIFMPPTPLAQLVATCPHVPSLQEIFTAGERLVITPALEAFLRRNPQVALYNQYGPTEGSIIVTSHRVDPDRGQAPPVGRPIRNVVVRILDASGQRVPLGVTGEIHLGGLATAAGYVGDPGLTADRFAAGFYRTGDLGRWRPDGTLEFAGRNDEQVKIRGNRVEPGEARRALERLPQVRQAAVVTRPGPDGEPRLVAYLVAAADLAQDWAAGFRAELAEDLPDYLIPEAWMQVDALPVSVNGKLAPDLLPDLPAALPDEAMPIQEPLTPAEAAVQDLWCAELNVASVPLDRSFFDAGGNSLMVVRLLERIRQRFGQQMPAADFMRQPTIRAVAKQVPM